MFRVFFYHFFVLRKPTIDTSIYVAKYVSDEKGTLCSRMCVCSLSKKIFAVNNDKLFEYMETITMAVKKMKNDSRKNQLYLHFA